MPQVDVVDETWLGVPAERLAPTVAEPGNWRRWWPELDLQVDQVRGVEGVRWSVRGHRVVGTMEIYLQPVDDGTLVHFYLRVDGRHRPLRGRNRLRVIRRYRRRAKQICWAMSDRIDPGRLGRVSPSRSL